MGFYQVQRSFRVDGKIRKYLKSQKSDVATGTWAKCHPINKAGGSLLLSQTRIGTMFMPVVTEQPHNQRYNTQWFRTTSLFYWRLSSIKLLLVIAKTS